MTCRQWQRVDLMSTRQEYVDWTALPTDIVIDLFTRLSNQDRSSLASTCSTWRKVGASPSLWRSLDLRATNLDLWKAARISGRCADLEKVRFCGSQSASAIVFLRVKSLLEISGDDCRKLSDATVCMLATRHKSLESLELGPKYCEKVTSEAIKVIASCCNKIKKLRLCGLKDVSGEAIASLAKHCPQLSDVAFLDCRKIDEVELGKMVSVRYLSVAGSNIDWSVAEANWDKFPNLIGLDVSGTNISRVVASGLMTSKSLKVFFAVKCPLLQEIASFKPDSFNGTMIFGFDAVVSLSVNKKMKATDVLAHWRGLATKKKSIEEIVHWSEWVISYTLLRLAECNSLDLTNFWPNGGTMLLISLLQSSQENVQERAATGVARFIIAHGQYSRVTSTRAEAFMQYGGISILLELARSRQEGVQSEAAKAMANLSINSKAATAIAEEGGIIILSGLAKSMNRFVAEEAAGGLWNLSIEGDHKNKIVQAGGVKALVDLLYRWPTRCNRVLERAAGALANLASDDKCSTVVAQEGGLHALVMLARSTEYKGAQEQAARALSNLAAHIDSNDNNAALGEEAGAIEILVKLTESPHDSVKLEAAGALWNLTFHRKNRESIAAFGGVKALVALAKSPRSIAFPDLQERAAGALMGLAASEEISIAIGNEGGIPPLLALVRSEHEDVHETAAGALWNLAFNPSNALLIVEERGIFSLGHLCRGSSSKMARFLATLALAYIFDGRMIWNPAERTHKSLHLNAAKIVGLQYIKELIATFVEPQFITAAALSYAPSMLEQVLEKARIVEAGHVRCSGCEIERFVTMLRNPSPELKTCAVFALLQFTLPGGRAAMHHASLIKNTGEVRMLRSVAASTSMSREGKVFARILLRNLEHHQGQASNG